MRAIEPTQFDQPPAAPAHLHETPPEPAFDRVTKLVSTMLDLPVSLFSIANRDRLHFKSNLGMSGPDAEAGSSPLSDTACQFVVGGGEPLPVEDAAAHPLLADRRLVRELGIRGYLGYPVCSPSGTPFGSLCAVASGTRKWTDRDIEMMATLAKTIEA
jgi:GAF domain-containing protein